MILSFILSLSFLGAGASTEMWQCRNDVEISCAAGKCEAEDY